MQKEMKEDQEEPFIPGPLGNKFMDIAETFSVLQGPYTILAEIPTTRKDGHMYICLFSAVCFFIQMSHLSVLGGQNRADTCRRVLRHCLTNDVAKTSVGMD